MAKREDEEGKGPIRYANVMMQDGANDATKHAIEATKKVMKKFRAEMKHELDRHNAKVKRT